MCLAIPSKIVLIEGDYAEIDVGGVKRKANISMTPEAKVGDYVLVHAGFSISVVDEEEARETISMMQELASYDPSFQVGEVE